MINATYRDIAQAATASLGTVTVVIKDLINLGYIVDMGMRGRRLKNRKKLLDRWLIAYPEQLRPKQEIGKYRSPDPNWWQTAEIQSNPAYWGGEVAADKLTHYLKPQTITIYAPEEGTTKLRIKNKLRKDPEGDIEILIAFWGANNENNQNGIVHPILIYADLIASNEPRNFETAQIIYDTELAEHFREN